MRLMDGKYFIDHPLSRTSENVSGTNNSPFTSIENLAPVLACFCRKVTMSKEKSHEKSS